MKPLIEKFLLKSFRLFGNISILVVSIRHVARYTKYATMYTFVTITYL